MHWNPTYSEVFSSNVKPSFDRKPSQITLRESESSLIVGFKQKDYLPCSISKTPPWFQWRNDAWGGCCMRLMTETSLARGAPTAEKGYFESEGPDCRKRLGARVVALSLVHTRRL